MIVPISINFIGEIEDPRFCLQIGDLRKIGKKYGMGVKDIKRAVKKVIDVR